MVARCRRPRASPGAWRGLVLVATGAALGAVALVAAMLVYVRAEDAGVVALPPRRARPRGRRPPRRRALPAPGPSRPSAAPSASGSSNWRARDGASLPSVPLAEARGRFDETQPGSSGLRSTACLPAFLRRLGARLRRALGGTSSPTANGAGRPRRRAGGLGLAPRPRHRARDGIGRASGGSGAARSSPHSSFWRAFPSDSRSSDGALELVARELIRDTIVRYAHLVDLGPAGRAVGLFTEDATLEAGDGPPARGRAAIRDVFAGTGPVPPRPHS
jgi:hypothetical protein